MEWDTRGVGTLPVCQQMVAATVFQDLIRSIRLGDRSIFSTDLFPLGG